MINIKINNIKIIIKKKTNIINITDKIGIYIPRFCYHKKLSISANCRMCLVEITGIKKLIPACSTIIQNNMNIITNNKKIKNCQKNVMEFLLLNHPLDCPICDKAGECELQDLTITFRKNQTRFDNYKKKFINYNINNLISTYINRCILCSRCIRFCKEIDNDDNIEIINRGYNSRIFMYLKSKNKTNLLGNIIDICPVGALISKISEFKYKSWQLIKNKYISIHDCLGSNITLHIFNNKIIRIIPRKKILINEYWISDKDRFSYEGIYHQDRIYNSLVKKNHDWEYIKKNNLINLISNKFKYVYKEFGGHKISTIASPSLTIEEFYIIQKLFRMLNSNNIDHRINQTDFLKQRFLPKYTGLNIKINNIDKQDLIFLIGIDLNNEQPILLTKIKKLSINKKKIYFLNPTNFKINFECKKFIHNINYFAEILSIIIKMIIIFKNNEYANKFFKIFYKFKIRTYYNKLIHSFIHLKHKLILLGNIIYTDINYHNILSLTILLSKLSNSNLGVITSGSNSSGACLAGFIPHKIFLNRFSKLKYNNILKNNNKIILLFEIEPEFDICQGYESLNILSKIEFVIFITYFTSKNIFKISNLIVPTISPYEKSGTFINISGDIQYFNSILKPNKKITKIWKIIKYISNNIQLTGFDYKNETNILNEFFLNLKNIQKIKWDLIKINKECRHTCNKILIKYLKQNSDSIIRRSKIKNNKIIFYDKLFMNLLTYKKLQINYKFIMIKKIKYIIITNLNISNNFIFIKSNNKINYYNLNNLIK